MSQIVRRVPTETVLTNGEDRRPVRSHRGSGLVVESQLHVGIRPELQLAWNVQPPYWKQGYVLMLFHSTTGFSPDRYPDSLQLHGNLIVETTTDGDFTIHPEEGTHYYSFLLHKRTLFGIVEKVEVVRFSETVPSAKVALSRIRDQIEFEDLRHRHEITPLEHEAKLNETKVRLANSRRQIDQQNTPPSKPRSPTEKRIHDELSDIDATVAAMFAQNTKLEELENDPRYIKLTKAQKKMVKDHIREALHPGEFRAARRNQK